MTRNDFLTEFLGSLGAVNIKWNETIEDSISGTVIYDLNDPEEIQDFIWHLKETEIPTENAYKLIKTINKHKLLDIDKITVNREQLKAIYCKEISCLITQEEFNEILEELKGVEVPMIDEGQESDIFFIHE